MAMRLPTVSTMFGVFCSSPGTLNSFTLFSRLLPSAASSHQNSLLQLSPPPPLMSVSSSSAPFPSFAAARARSYGFRWRRSCRTMAVSGNEVRQAPDLVSDRPQLEVGYSAPSRKKEKVAVAETAGLEVLYEDGFGTANVKDYFDAVRSINKPDGGPPRWFCPVECGAPLKGVPLLYYLPDADGTGMGLILHHKSLGKVFEVRCLHVPVNDRTTFEGLVRIVEDSVRKEHAMSPGKPIYLLGDSFGGCLALAVAIRNPMVDLVLILVNPATSFEKSQLLTLLPVLESLPSNLHFTIPYLLSSVIGDPVKMAMAGISTDLPHPRSLEELLSTLVSMLPLPSELGDIVPRDTLLWKLKLIKSGAAYVNSRLHAVKAEVLMLASGKDKMLPSGDEADRFHALFQRCKVRYFKDNGHALLLEDGINLLNIIKATTTYRLSKQHDYVADYLYPTRSEFNKAFIQGNRFMDAATSPVFLSTDNNGRIVRGLAGIPDKGPVLLVGYHMLLGLELAGLYKAFLEEKKIVIRGMAHPIMFSRMSNTSRQEVTPYDTMKVFGALPVNPINMYKLFSRESFVLMYPGGVREALHLKGEEYKLIWPDQPEFIRMAARFGATIVPFGVVGEDDIAELVLDYNDQKKIPLLREFIETINEDEEIKIRVDMEGEISKQKFYVPGLLPKLPGRFYYLFGKPFETRGKDFLKDREQANVAYKQIQSEIEGLLSYLKDKREKDPYRSIAQRALYQASRGALAEVPTFEH